LPALSSIAQIFLSERTSFTSQQPRSLSIALTSTKLTSTFPGAERAGLSARLALAFGCHGDLDASLLGLRSAEIGVAGEGLPVAVSLLAVAGGLVGAGQATVGPYLFVLVTALDRQGQRGGVPSAGLVDLARGEERFAKTVERLGLTRAIAGLAVEGQRLPEMADGLTAAALPQLGKAQASQRPGLAQPATDLAAQPQGLPEMASGLQVTALPQATYRSHDRFGCLYRA
jgi:hypothetical protein